jgi:hypothetical protein
LSENHPRSGQASLTEVKRASAAVILSVFNNNKIQFNSIYLCAKLNSPEANYKVSTGKKMGRVRSKKVSENNILIKVKIIKYKMTMSTLLVLLLTTA